jgi:hypothetical protein
MGNKNQIDIKKLNFQKDDEVHLQKFYSKFVTNNTLATKELIQDLFPNLDLTENKFISCMNDYYKLKKLAPITEISYKEVVYLAYLLTNINQNDEDEIKTYYGKGTFEIIYDIFSGKVGSYSNLTTENVIQVLGSVLAIYIQKHDIELAQSKTNLENFFKNMKNDLKTFIEQDLYNLEPFLKSHYKKLFFDTHISFEIPILTEPSSILTSEKFFFYVLSNPHVYGKKYTFKLYDCNKNGFSISSLIYSFIGFGGPVTIFIQHFDKTENKEYILGAYLNSSFKECYEKYCGDEFTKLFCISPLKYYPFQGNKDKICYINSKQQKYSNKQAGIGFGDSYGKYKLWLDQNDPFSKSYFNKYDDVFEEGSPLKEPEEFLNVNYF